MTDKNAATGAQADLEAGALEAAARRLATALDALEAAVEQRKESDHSEARLAEQIQALGTDRSNLAAELDGMSARARRLEEANREVVQRIDGVMETVRSVLGTAADET
jgi:prefoldin subunit 5